MVRITTYSSFCPRLNKTLANLEFVIKILVLYITGKKNEFGESNISRHGLLGAQKG